MSQNVINYNSIPYYLQRKLLALQIHSYEELLKYDYIELYKYLNQLNNNSLALQVLFDLYCIYHQLELHSLNPEQKSQILKDYKAYPVVYLPLEDEIIQHNLQLAYEQSYLANISGEVPVGAIIVLNGQVIARGYNQVLANSCSTKHAEIIAIEGACQILQNYRLEQCDLYITLEPCLMCAGAIINSRFKRVIFSCYEPNTGAVSSQYQVFNNTQVNKHTQAIKANYLDDTYQKLLIDFFKARR